MSTAGRNRRRMLARAGGLNALVLDLVLVIVVLFGGDAEGMFVLAPSAAGGALALTMSDRPGVLAAAAALVFATAVFLFIGGIGLLFVLPTVLLFLASVTQDGPAATE